MVGAANASTCRQVKETCIDSTDPKIVNGVEYNFSDFGITDSCWQWAKEYDCVDTTSADLVDYCSALDATPGCSVTTTSCVAYSSLDGACEKWNKTYRCGDKIVPNAGTVQLDNSYTIVYDETDSSPCTSYSSNASCQQSAKVCIDGPGTKNIDGLDVFKECWKWREDYNCVVSNPHDYCMPLKQAGCTIQQEICTTTAFTGSCIGKQSDYICGEAVSPLPSDIQVLDTSYTIVDDKVDYSKCSSLESNANCQVASQVCIDGPGTKNINGLDVYKECWEWKKDYTCASTTLTSTCADLKANPLCTETASNCVDVLPGGQCGLLEHQYKCSDSPPTTSTVENCGTQSFCLDGQCFDTGYSPDQDLVNAITHMELAREIVNYDIFVGEASSCHNNLLKNCCKSKSGGQGGRNDVISQTLGTAALKLGAEEVYVWGSKFLFEGLMNSGSEILAEYAMSALSSGVLSTTGSFTVWGAEFAVSTSGVSFVGFDPYSLALSIAIYVIMDMMTCEQEEQVLGMKRGQGLCHKVGSWCSSKVLGSCVEKKEGWCCFPSKLGRIVNEQGRAQISKSWGSPKSPDCSGFTIEELKLLRFDLMDLSEFFTSITIPTKSSQFAIDRLNQKAKSYYGN